MPPEQRCRWCGANYRRGGYRAHLHGQPHRTWLDQQRRSRAAWRAIVEYKRLLLAAETGASSQ